jgi:hypothetical protein
MKRVLTSMVVLFFLVFWLALGVFDLGQTQAAQTDTPITFSNQIVRLMQKHCQSCHHSGNMDTSGHNHGGGIAPFPLTTYAEVFPRAQSIKSAVTARRMPAAVTARLHTGCSTADTFEGPRRLTNEEIVLFTRWVNSGAPEGNPADLPPPLDFSDDHHHEWKGGEPDMVMVNAPQGFVVPPGYNQDFFRRFPVAPKFDADRYIVGFEAIPGTGDLGRRVNIVHHVTLFIDPTCGSLEQEKNFAASNPKVPGPGFEGEFTYPTELVGMWFPGTNPLKLQEGAGIKVPRGACLITEVHYTTWHPEPITDRTVVGLQFARAPILKVRTGELVNNETFVIPANNPYYEVVATRVFDEPFTIYSLATHMHQLGKDAKVEAELPNGQKQCLVDVDFDFKHQGTYIFKQPRSFPAGTRITMRGYYNNSVDHPHQLSFPPIDIPFGRTSDREMCQATLGMSYDKQQLVPSSPTIARVSLVGLTLIASGSDLRTGAWLEVNGKLLLDTKLSEDKSSVSAPPTSWLAAASRAAEVKVAIVNADGGRSATLTFSRSPYTGYIELIKRRNKGRQ